MNKVNFAMKAGGKPISTRAKEKLTAKMELWNAKANGKMECSSTKKKKKPPHPDEHSLMSIA